MAEAPYPDSPSGTDFAALYREQWRPLLRLAQSLVDDAASAEDVVQEAFAALYRRQGLTHEVESPAGYLRISVLNGARSALRRRRTVRARLSLVRDDRHAPAADEPVLLSAEHDAVRTTLSTLPRRQREVLSLRFLCYLSDEEIAHTTGMSHANVRSAASRGLAALRASIGGPS